MPVAPTNTISFQGEVKDEICSLTINGNEASPVILLPTVSAGDLAAAGDVAGATSFNMMVSGCTGSSTATNISTVFVGNLVDSTNAGALRNTGTAQHVTIQLRNTGAQPINLTSRYTAQGDLSLASGEPEATSTFSAQSYGIGPATPGTVAAPVQYAISYQ